MRVVCTLRELQEELGLSSREIGQQLKIDWRTIDKLAGRRPGPWELTREKLYRLMMFAHQHGYEAFRIVPHPIWRTFDNSAEEVKIFRGSNRTDATVEEHLSKYFEQLRCMTETTTEPDELQNAMKTRNCVIIGSPKLNRASEMAFALLWGAAPFDAKPQNRDRIPVHFLGMDPDWSGPSALLAKSTRHGLHVRVPDLPNRGYLRITWLPPDRYESSTEDGQEGAVLVVCNRPLGTKQDVTTVIIAGYSGLSTLEAAREATYKQIPDLRPSDSPGQPTFAILRFDYRKRAGRGKSARDLRTVKSDTVRWGPPWDGFFA